MVLIEAVDGVGNETAQRYKQCCRQSAIHRVGKFAEVDVLTKLKTNVEASAHETGEKGDGKSLGEIEVLNGCLLLLFRER